MAASEPQFEIYENAQGWSWRLRAVNGDVLAQGTQGYTDRAACVYAQDLVALALHEAVLQEVDS